LDSCLMSMVEICYEMTGLAEYIVGAEGFELEGGWPYHSILEELNRDPGMSERELACAIVERYIKYYSDYVIAGVSVDQAACHLNKQKFKNLTDAVKRLATELRTGLTIPVIMDAIILAHWKAQSYKVEQYTDLWDFCDLLFKWCEPYNKGEISITYKVKENSARVKDAIERMAIACDQVKQAIKNENGTGVVLKSCYSGTTVQYSQGLSIYFPWNDATFSNDYLNLEFAKERVTGWHKFLGEYITATRRVPRNDC